MIKWFKNLSIRKKLLYYMLVFTVIPIALVTAIALTVNYNKARDQLIYYHRMSSGWLQDRLNVEMQDTFKQIYSFEADKKVREKLINWCVTDKELNYDDRWVLITALNSIISIDSSINSIELYNYKQGEVLIAERSGATMKKTGGRLDFWKDHDDNLQKNLVFYRTEKEILEVHQIYRFEDNSPIGLMVAHLRPYALQKLLDEIKSVPEESIMILNDMGNIIEADYGEEYELSESTVAHVRKMLSESEQKETLYNERFWFYRPIGRGKLQLLVAVPEKTISETLLPTLMMGIFIACATAFIGIVCSVGYSALISKPITKLSKEMQNLKLDNYNSRQSSQRTDEIGVLQESFDLMIARNKELIEKEYQSKIAKRSAQLRALQAQINPHFMYNTLQVIGGMALGHDAPEIYRITLALCDIMRYSLSFSKEMVKLSEEAEYLKSYIMIQNERFGGRIRMELDFQEETLDLLVPKLILQPLAENSFEYGFSDKTGDCVIRFVSQINEDGNLKIEVIDNGVGFTPKRLEEVNKALKSDADNSMQLNSHIGLRNVHSRLRLHGDSDKYGLSVKSDQYRETVVTILTKAIKEQGEQNVQSSDNR
ncbi:MAG: sensor histidine kinase [Lachnospiraceae bacterium]|nr:sensor histidine kinase [Lachnospiraceae bacterium]